MLHVIDGGDCEAAVVFMVALIMAHSAAHKSGANPEHMGAQSSKKHTIGTSCSIHCQPSRFTKLLVDKISSTEAVLTLVDSCYSVCRPLLCLLYHGGRLVLRNSQSTPFAGLAEFMDSNRCLALPWIPGIPSSRLEMSSIFKELCYARLH
jgi:hypothetical protein